MKRLFLSMLTAIGVHGGLSAEQKHDVVIAGYQTAPGVGAAAGAHVAGLQLSDVLVISSIGFVLMQAAYLVWKWRRDARRELERSEDRRAGRKVSHCETKPDDL
jgi:predicted MFS family arabinose efflux permease